MPSEKGHPWDLFTIGEAARISELSTGRIRQLCASQNVGRKVGKNWLFTSEDISILRKRPWRKRNMLLITKKQALQDRTEAIQGVIKYFEARLIDERRYYQEQLLALAWRACEVEKAVDRLTEAVNERLGLILEGRPLPSVRRIVVGRKKPKMIDVTPKTKGG